MDLRRSFILSQCSLWVWGRLSSYIENTTYDSIATNVYIVAMVFILTALTLSSLINFRREVQSIYFYYFSANNVERGANFLRLRTVLIKGVESMDMDGGRLRRTVDNVFHEQAVYGKMYGTLFLPDYHGLFSFEYQRRELIFFREISQKYEFNPLFYKWAGKSVLEHDVYETAMDRIGIKMSNFADKRRNSGYAFACFSTFSAIKKLKQNFERWIN